MIRVFPGGASGKNPACNARDLRDVGLKKKKKKRDVGLIPGSGIFSGGGHGNVLQYAYVYESSI